MKPVIGGLLWAALALPLWAAPFSNGSFEQPGNGPLRIQIHNTEVTGWVHAGTGYEIYESSKSDNIDAKDGGYYVSFGHNGTTGGTLSQTFDTVAGKTYRVNYWVSSQQGVAPGQSMSAAALDPSGKRLALVETKIGEQNVWSAGTQLEFVANAASTTLVFTDTTDQQTAGSSSANWGLDAVTVQDASPQTRSIVGVGSGDISSLTVGATIKVASSEFGQRINIYVVGLIEQLMVFKHGERFEFPTRQLPATLPVAQTATASAEAIQVPILSGYDMRGAKGALFLVGYGTSDADMLAQGKYAVIYVVP